MAQVYRPSYFVTDPVTGARTKKQSPTWHVRFYLPSGERRRVKGYRDWKATKALAVALARRAARHAAGIFECSEPQAKRSLSKHLADFEAHLQGKGSTPKQVALKVGRVRRLLEGCGFVRVVDLDADRVQAYLAELRARGVSAQTSNYYLKEGKSFCRWLAWTGGAAFNALQHVVGANARADCRHPRRPLQAPELLAAIQAARKSPKSFRGLTGLDRAMLYSVAAGTGFRVSELASLEVVAFDLDGSPPTVTLHSRHAKDRKTAVQPLPADLVEPLRCYFRSKFGDQPADAFEAMCWWKHPVWPGTWPERAAAMFRRDLAAAGVPYVMDGPDGRRYADFHSLRHTFISLLDRSGASLKEAMQLARHSDPRLTAAIYGRAQLRDLAEVVRRLPSFQEAVPEGMASTGTDGSSPTELDPKHVAAWTQ